MTPNEKELLGKFKEVDEASVVKMSREMALSIDYTKSLCKSLVAQGFLEVVTPGRWPVYKVREEQGIQEGEKGAVKKVVRRRVRRKRREEIKVSRPMVEVKCAYCKGTGKDPWGIMSVLTNCQVCKGKGTVKIAEPFEKCPVCHGTGAQQNKRLSCLACGGKGVLTVPKEPFEKCPVCHGTGVQYNTKLNCLACGGKGVLTMPEEAEVCPKCKGTGKDAFGLYCLKCKGRGKIRKRETIKTLKS